MVRVGYNIPGITDRVRLVFSQFLNVHFAGQISPEQRQHIENTQASRPVKSEGEWKQITAALSRQEKIAVIASLRVLQGLAEQGGNPILARTVGEQIQSIVSALDLHDAEAEIETLRISYQEEAHRYQHRPEVTIPLMLWPLVVDYLLRWVLLIALTETGSASFLAIVNPYFSILMLVMIYFIGRRHRKDNSALLARFGGESEIKLSYRLTSGQYTLLGFLLGSGVFISYCLKEPLHVYALIGLPVYYFLYLRAYPLGRLQENDLVLQLNRDQVTHRELDRDQNDEVLVGLETRLNSLTGRLEAYVLESALFGALTFSGFLQIMSSELVTFQSLERFADSVFSMSRSFVQLDTVGLSKGLLSLNSKEMLFCLISVESLICSVLFLGVIATRLRFSNVADRVREALNLAKAYNEKEEAAFDHGTPSQDRHVQLTERVNAQLRSTERSMEELEPVMAYMQYFRNGGILTFLVILLSSTLFITGVLGWTFLILVAATLGYFNWEQIQVNGRALALKLRIAFMSGSLGFFGLSLVPFVIGFILENVFFIKSEWLFALGWLLLGLYLFGWLLLGTHVDKEFGDIGDRDSETRLKRWRVVKAVMAFVSFTLGLGMAFKQLHLDGANALVMLSNIIFSCQLFVVGYYLSKKWWMGVMGGYLLATTFIGALFKILHFPGAQEMLSIGLVINSVLIPLLYWQRKRFHFLFIRIVFVGWFLSAMLYFRLYSTAELMVSHRTWSLSMIRDVEISTETNVDTSLAAMDLYIRRYGTKFGYNSVYKTVMASYYNGIHDMVSQAKVKNDTLLIRNALDIARMGERIEALFSYDPDYINVDLIGMEAGVWLDFNNPEKAIESLERILANHPPASVAEQVRGRIEQIRKSNPSLQQ